MFEKLKSEEKEKGKEEKKKNPCYSKALVMQKGVVGFTSASEKYHQLTCTPLSLPWRRSIRSPRSRRRLCSGKV